MTRRPAASRRGITLTEILISILIMGVGVISLATLFPLGMVRLRAASQQHRSALLAESAGADLVARGLLFKPSFLTSWYSWDPFTADLYPNAAARSLTMPITINQGAANQAVFSYSPPPVCYDPLWWYETGNAPNSAVATIGEVRFGQGVFLNPASNSFVRATSSDGSSPAAHGLQRISNFITPAQLSNFTSLANWALLNPETTFASPDDPVMQNSDATPEVLSGPVAGGNQSALSGIVPQWFPAAGNTAAGFRNDLRYTWLFTGNQIDLTTATAFVGNIVVMDSRPFALDQVLSPTGSGTSSPTAAGEIVMEGVFGYSTNIANGFGVAADRTVLLRWPAAMPDPEIKVGSWIADVTYQRDLNQIQSLVNAGTISLGDSLQRCHWYQVAKKGDVMADPDVTGYRRMVVTTTTPVKAMTRLGTGGLPVIMNTALFMPSVVNVYQRAIEVRP